MEAQATIITYKGPAVLERVVLAAGLAGAIVASQLLPGYPAEWRALLPLAVLALGLWTTIGAYFATVAVLAYPLWALSPYLMGLFVALALVPHRLILQHLALVLLVVWSPALALGRVELAIPVLVGALAGARRGAFAGALAALWIKGYAAMSGNPLDLLLIQGNPGSPAGVAERFAGAESLDTLRLIVAPFMPNSSELLGNLLQIAALVGAGAVAGWLANWGRARIVLHDLDDTPPIWQRLAGRLFWTAILPAGSATAALGAALLLVPFAVGRPLSDLGLHEAGALLLTKGALGGGLVLALLGGILLLQPLPPGVPRRTGRKAAAQPLPLPPLDLSAVQTGRFVPSWAAEAGLVAPLPTPDGAAVGSDYTIEDSLTTEAGTPATEPGATVTELPAAPSPPVRRMAPPAREIAIELD